MSMLAVDGVENAAPQSLQGCPTPAYKLYAVFKLALKKGIVISLGQTPPVLVTAFV